MRPLFAAQMHKNYLLIGQMMLTNLHVESLPLVSSWLKQITAFFKKIAL